MLDTVKNFWKTRIAEPLSTLLAPVGQRLSAWFEPIAEPLRPYKERFDQQWATFYFNHPRLATWLRRGTKVAGFLYLCYFVFAIGLFGEIPTVEELRDLQTLNTSEVYTADSVLIGKFYKENRKDIPFDAIPTHTVDALVSTEDKRYWEHTGVDFRALGRVFYYSILKGDERSGGGSTLSQQLAKNVYGRKQFFAFSTAINKVREMLIARRLERAYDKKNLLAFYLNTVPFGGNVFGIEMAAKRFFNKSAKDLKVEEGAVLVGMLQQNTRFNPRRNPQNSLKRRNEVLDNLVENGKMTKKQVELLKRDTIKLDYQPVLNRDAMASYFKDYLRTILPKMLEPYKKDDGTPYDIYKDGLRIYGSIDSKMQLLAEEAVSERMNELQKQFDNAWYGEKWWGDDRWLEDAMRNSDRWKRMAAEGKKEAAIMQHFKTAKIPMTIFMWENGKPAEDERTMTPLDSIKYYFRQLNTGFMASDPKTGLIKAWVGGTDFNFFQYDHCRSRRQVGSVFKPIVYAKAVQAGIRPCEYISNKLIAYGEDHTTKDGWDVKEEDKANYWLPHNSDGGYSGSYSLEGALTNSVNVVTANLIFRFGIDPVRDLAKAMGVTNELQRDLSIALGTSDISLYDMMKVYGTFAARGKRPEPVAVLKVVTRDGKVVADFSQQINPANWQQVLSPDHSDIMTKMMRSVVSDGTASRLNSKYNVSTNIAGKTGTTQSQADGWFMCYTPNIVCGAWVGGMTPAVRFRDMSSGQGAASALPICGLFLQKMYKTPQYAAMKDEKFPEPAKWIKDSMDCDPHVYAPGELDEEVTIDTVGVQYPVDFFNEKPVTPQDEVDKNDLRDKSSGGTGTNNAPQNTPQNAPQPDKSAAIPAGAKPEAKPATTPAKPVTTPTKPVTPPTSAPVKTTTPAAPAPKPPKINIGN
jgi:penicillin-binding protein 1A